MDSEQKDNITMEHNEIITDELIAKYISGKTTEEEDKLIHDYLAQHPEFANDLLDIATALRHQRKHDEATGQVDQERPHEAKRVAFTKRRTFYYAAASVVVIISIGLLWFKPFAQNDTKQTLAGTDTEITNTNPTNDGEVNELNPTDITPIDLQPEEALLADNQEAVSTPKQESTFQPIAEESYLADNNTPGTTQQQEITAPSNDDNAPTMAALTVEDDSGTPLVKDAVFVTDNIPSNCDPHKELVLNWDCNAPILKIEFSIDNGATWKTSYNVSGQNSLTIKPGKLNVFKDYSNTNSFIWRMTAQYSDGKLVRQGTVVFSE